MVSSSVDSSVEEGERHPASLWAGLAFRPLQNESPKGTVGLAKPQESLSAYQLQERSQGKITVHRQYRDGVSKVWRIAPNGK